MNCIVCGVGMSGRRRTYCSPTCADKNAHSGFAYKEIPRQCAECGCALSRERLRRQALYCGPACYKEAQRKKYLENNPGRRRGEIPSGTVGAASELIVCADLLARGVAVFRSVSPSCSCDLLAMRGVEGRTVRVEVTSGSMSGVGALTWPRKDAKKHDLLAVVYQPGNKIMYLPPIEEAFSTNGREPGAEG